MLRICKLPFKTLNYLVLVTLEAQEVIAYATGCDFQKLKPEFCERLMNASLEVKNCLSSGRIYYHRHIAKKPGQQNIGKPLLASLLNKIKEQGYHYVVCQIAHHPLQNKISIALHEKLGFRRVGTMQDGEVTLGIYLKEA